MTVISFYNDVDGKTFYSDCAKRLKENCERLGLKYAIEPRDYGENWIDNERAKPTFIREMMSKLEDDLLWIDVDCVIKRVPDIDLNRRYRWGIRFRSDGTPHDYVHFINNSSFNAMFITSWINEIERCGKGSHTAFVNLFDMLDAFELQDDYELVEADIPSKTAYLDSAFKKD